MCYSLCVVHLFVIVFGCYRKEDEPSLRFIPFAYCCIWIFVCCCIFNFRFYLLSKQSFSFYLFRCVKDFVFVQLVE